MTSTFDARKSFYAALAKAQGQIEGAAKDKENPAFRGSKYADLGAVWDACREALSSNGLAVIQMPDYDPETKCVTVETIITHADGFEKASRLRVPTAKQDAQGVGSAITYGRRYALMAAVGIAPEDDDGNAAAATGYNKNTGKRTSNSLKQEKDENGFDPYTGFTQKIDTLASDGPISVEEWWKRGDVQARIGEWPKAWQESAQEYYETTMETLLNAGKKVAAE